jgi:hypothetical protein
MSIHLLSKNTSIRLYVSLIFLLFYMGVKLGLSWEGEEHKLRVFDNVVRGKISGPKTGAAAGGCRKCHSEELYSLHSSPNIIQVLKSWSMRWVGHVICTGKRGNAYRVFVAKPLGRCECRQEVNSSMDLEAVEWEGVDWINQAEDKGCCEFCDEPLASVRYGNLLTS